MVSTNKYLIHVNQVPVFYLCILRKYFTGTVNVSADAIDTSRVRSQSISSDGSTSSKGKEVDHTADHLHGHARKDLPGNQAVVRTTTNGVNKKIMQKIEVNICLIDNLFSVFSFLMNFIPGFEWRRVRVGKYEADVSAEMLRLESG
jgi:hypothetical protein